MRQPREYPHRDRITIQMRIRKVFFVRRRFGLWERQVVRIGGVVDQLFGELCYDIQFALFEIPFDVSIDTM